MPNPSIICAHADDELLAFGPLLHHFQVTGEPVNVVCAFFSGVTRANQFNDCVKSLGANFNPVQLNTPDAESGFEAAMHSEVEGYLTQSKPSVVYSHDPVFGDVGSHTHHKTLGQVVHKIWPMAWLLHREGWSDNIKSFKFSTPLAYEKYVIRLLQFYSANYDYLEREKCILKAKIEFRQFSVLHPLPELVIKMEGEEILKNFLTIYPEHESSNCFVFNRTMYDHFTKGDLSEVLGRYASGDIVVSYGLLEDDVLDIIYAVGYKELECGALPAKTTFSMVDGIPMFSVQVPIRAFLRS